MGPACCLAPQESLFQPLDSLPSGRGLHFPKEGHYCTTMGGPGGKCLPSFYSWEWQSVLPIISLFEGLPYYLNWSVKPFRVSVGSMKRSAWDGHPGDAQLCWLARGGSVCINLSFGENFPFSSLPPFCRSP